MQLFQDFNNEEFDVSKFFLIQQILLTPKILTTVRQDMDVVMQEPYVPRVSDSDREYIPS